MPLASDNAGHDTTRFILELLRTIDEATSLLETCRSLPPQDTEADKAFAGTRSAILSLLSSFLDRWTPGRSTHAL